MMVINDGGVDGEAAEAVMDARRPAPGTCPPPALLRAEAEGVLPDDMAARVQAHVSSCEWCRRLRDALAAVDVDAMTPEEELRIRMRIDLGRRRVTARRRLRAWAPALAAAALIVLAVWLPGPVLPPLPRNPPMARAASIVHQAPNAGDVLVARPAAIELPAASLRTRGTADAVAARFAAAMKPYAAGDYADAARQLAPLAARAPGDARVRFYFGVSLLLAGRPDDAVAPLAAARQLDDERFGTESTWYLAVAHRRAGRSEAAQAELSRLCGRPVAHGIDACAALEALSPRLP